MPPPIRGLVENTLLDWEGKVAAVVFLPGCNFRCAYCHARDLVEPVVFDETIPLEAVLLNLRRQRGWLDGVVISGGEPTLHSDLLEFIQVLRDEGAAIKLDTNGSRPDVLEELLNLGVLDCVAMDLKAPLNARYSEVARVTVDLDAICRSIELLMSSEIDYEFRTTVCPTLLNYEDIVGIAKSIQGAKLYYLQAFRPVNCLERSLEALKPYNPDVMREFCRASAPYVQRCAVRGDQSSEVTTAINK